ncbi:extensin-like [Punica granatum]|uniref:Extensin-like n=1 Tax=Punica granatum TaxID=22663 RepID=A0A6P8BX66_PUNGR|nr:extensin-like [Punica granatum]
MVQENHTGIPEEINPPAPVHPQSPTAQTTLPLNSAGAPLAYPRAPSTYFPLPTTTGASLPRSGFPPLPPVYAPPLPMIQTPPPIQDTTRIAALEDNVATLHGTMNLMATNMAEMMALLRDPNHASSNSTPPLASGSTVDPAPWAPPTLAPEGDTAAATPTTPVHQPAHVSTVYPADFFQPQPTVPAVAPLPPMTIDTPGPTVFASPPLSIPAIVYTVPPPTVFPTSNAPASAPAQST